MNVIVETVVVLFQVAYLWLQAIVLAFIPASYRSKDVAGETVLVTGAGSGLGRLLSIRFARRGCRLILWDVNTQGMAETAEMLRKLGSVPIAYTVDLSKKEQIYDTAEQVKRDVGEVDILVNNAGIVTGKKFLECKDELIQKTMDVNIMAHFWTVKCFVPGMLERNHGHIVNIASAAGISGVNGLADYCASKFAAVGFDESLRMEFLSMEKTGVHTTVICPFYINTGMFEGVQTRFPLLLPILDPDYVADSIINGVLTNTHIVMLPPAIAFVAALKGIIPVKCGMILSNFFGVNHTMDNFKGRQKRD
ncbi:epidermal retinol dehydrogenase 2-like [Haliotis rufescens]|uniref:epidermal retinol dehydrogenase 2-like n=1 Tax=Haliotis rufescens TaxID=6454 RepID=UPI00201EBCAF|nr:epidermal retinol dehydrogenase 2-like [Haliotis rufescens]